MRLIRFILPLVLASCAAEGPVSYNESPIVDGLREAGYPEVMFLYNTAVGSACTATLISPRVVLTAKHCVQNGNSPSAAPASNFRLFVGESSSRPRAQYTVSEVIPAPGRWDLRDASDVALLVLPAPAAEEPRRVNFGGTTGLTNFTAIGYGQTPSGRSGTKMRAEKTVDGAGRGFIFVRPSVCRGDSGGPLIAPDGTIYGVASYIYSETGGAPRCGTAPGAYNAIQAYQELIEDTIESTGGCIPSEEICNGADDNCDGTIDEGCSAFGEACSSGNECASGLCDETEVGVVCTQVCDPLRANLGCPPGYFCQNAGGCEGVCAPQTEDLSLGEECSLSGECASGYCAAVGEATLRCHSPCGDGQGMCLAGEVCFANEGSCGACVDAAFVAPPRDQGEPCEADEDCTSGVCMDDAGVRFCSNACSETDACDEGFHCRAGQCIPGEREDVGGGCLENEDCAAGFCAVQGERAWCSAFCETVVDCPLGFGCTDAGDQRICTPANGIVGDQCEMNEECITGLCVSNTSRGSVCSRFCDADLGCSAGFECQRVGESAVCLRPGGSAMEMEEEMEDMRIPVDEGGGCSASGGQGSALWWVFGFIALWHRRRGH